MTAKELWDKLLEEKTGILDHDKIYPRSPIFTGGRRIHCVQRKGDKYWINIADPKTFPDIDYSLYGTPKQSWVA